MQVRVLFPVRNEHIPPQNRDELKQKLREQLGLEEGVSQQAIELVLGFVKDKLPENMQGLVDQVAGGEDVGGDALGAVKGLLGGG